MAGTFSPLLQKAILFPAHPLAGQALLFLILFGFSWVALHYHFTLPSGYWVSFDISLGAAAFFLISPAAGALLSCVTVLSRKIVKEGKGLWERKGWIRLAENVGNRMLRVGFTWLAYHLAGGTMPPTKDPTQLLPALLALIAYFLANNLFYLPTEVFRGGQVRGFLREALRSDLLFTVIICVFGYMMALMALYVGVVAMLLQGGIILVVSRLFSLLTQTQEELTAKLDDLVALTQVTIATNSGLDVLPMVSAFTRKLAETLKADGIGVVFFQRYSTTLYLVQCEGPKNRATYLPEEKRFQYEQLPLSEPSERLGKRLFEFLMPLETAPFMLPASTFGLPLLHGGEPFGGIVVYSYQEGVTFQKRQSLLETCAQALVVALENCFLHLQAIQDPLTGLYNRSYFLYRIEEELAFSSRHRAPFAILMMDLDDFKAVNDHLGHAAGDKVLHRIGDLLRSGLRREDVPARYGGDEFILLLLGCEEKSALDKTERLRRAIISKALPKEEAHGLSIGCSVGILTSARLHGDQDVPSILKRLDEALYKAKSGGKNRIVMAD